MISDRPAKWLVRGPVLALFVALVLVLLVPVHTTRPSPATALWPDEPEGCTSIEVGRLATVDGSVITCHTCDGRYRQWVNIVPRQKWPEKSTAKVYSGRMHTETPEDLRGVVQTGEIPQVPETYRFLNTAYPCLNEHGLAIGETTIGGRRELVNTEGMFMIEELERIALERCRTAREAVKLIGQLVKEYGYGDFGECITIADGKEVWHLEIMGAGPLEKGAVWAAVRIPDDHVGVSANAHRIRQIDPKNPDRYMASDNVFSLAQEMGWWSPESGAPFEFCYAYADRTSLYCRRREWRVLSLLAPSLKLDPNAENFPLSVKPDKKVSVQDLLAVFRDTYEGTPFDMTRYLTVTGPKGVAVKSPVANPFMSADLRELFHIQRERTIAAPTATYLQICQARSWLPNPIGGLVWLGYDNPATTPHMPFYIGITQMPESFMVDGRRGVRRDCAWWAFRMASKLTYIRYQEMKEDARKVWKPIEEAAFAKQKEIEEEALRLYRTDPAQAEAFLTKYCHETAGNAVAAYWKLVDDLWSKYNNLF